MIGSQLDPSARSGAAPGQSMTPIIKQETNVIGGPDHMVPGQTHIGSPDAVPPYVDSTTYPTRLTPPGSNPDFFNAEELINGTDSTNYFLFRSTYYY